MKNTDRVEMRCTPDEVEKIEDIMIMLAYGNQLKGGKNLKDVDRTKALKVAIINTRNSMMTKLKHPIGNLAPVRLDSGYSIIGELNV